MKERPILFSGAMVRALLDGRKTQTRRVARRIPVCLCGHPATEHREWAGHTAMWACGKFSVADACPYGTIGDRLWVRETWAELALYSLDAEGVQEYRTVYRADGEADGLALVGDRWRPSIHMPRWASRITLEITGVRVERVADIGEADARAEGLKGLTKDGTLVKWGIPDLDGLPGTDDQGWPWSRWDADPRNAYRTLWDSINGKRSGCSWEANPWVWIVEFKRVEQETAR